MLGRAEMIRAETLLARLRRPLTDPDGVVARRTEMI
jgi:hypothetical protein